MTRDSLLKAVADEYPRPVDVTVRPINERFPVLKANTAEVMRFILFPLVAPFRENDPEMYAKHLDSLVNNVLDYHQYGGFVPDSESSYLKDYSGTAEFKSLRNLLDAGRVFDGLTALKLALVESGLESVAVSLVMKAPSIGEGEYVGRIYSSTQPFGQYHLMDVKPEVKEE